MAENHGATMSDWAEAFKDPTAFAALLASDVVLEASALRGRADGKTAVLKIMRTGAAQYGQISFMNTATVGDKTYSEWHAVSADGSVDYGGVTVLTTGDTGQIVHIALRHRPLDALLKFSAAMGEALRKDGMADQFYTPPPR